MHTKMGLYIATCSTKKTPSNMYIICISILNINIYIYIYKVHLEVIKWGGFFWPETLRCIHVFFGARSGRDMDAVHGACDRYGVWYIGTVCGTLVRCVGTIQGYSAPFMRTHVPRPCTRSKNKSLYYAAIAP